MKLMMLQSYLLKKNKKNIRWQHFHLYRKLYPKLKIIITDTEMHQEYQHGRNDNEKYILPKD